MKIKTNKKKIDSWALKPMKGRTGIASLLFVIVLASCISFMSGCSKTPTGQVIGTSPDIENPVIIFRTYGGFINPDVSNRVLSIDNTTTTYLIMDAENNTVQRYSKPTDLYTYANLTSLLNLYQFLDFQNSHTAPSGAAIPDVGNIDIIVSQPGVSKKVTIFGGAEKYMPSGSQSIINQLQSEIDYVTNTTETDTETLAQAWIMNAPTYKFDGSSLSLINISDFENVPNGYILTYRFSSSHPGYGDRTGQALQQTVTPHTIMVKILDSEVVYAHIDQKWDELRQVMLPSNINFMLIKYQPMQCQATPWEQWYLNGSITFNATPSDSDLAILYYSLEQGIEISAFKRVDTNATVCLTCNVCPQSYYYSAMVPEDQSAEMLDLGWLEFVEPVPNTPAPTSPGVTQPTNVPDFQSLGFNNVLDDEKLGSIAYATVTTGPYTIEFPANTFIDDVNFKLLSANPSSFQGLVPDNETAILAFAFKITDLATNKRIGIFENTVSLTLYDEDINYQSKYYNLYPNKTITLNANGLEASDDFLTHPLSGAMVAWIITSPTVTLEGNLSQNQAEE